MRIGIVGALILTSAAPPPPAAGSARATFDALRTVDLRLAGIAYRLTTANAPLCSDLAPTPGWLVHAIGQYDPNLRADAKASFGFETPIAIEGVVPGAPAQRAGVAANDSLLAVNGKAVGEPISGGGAAGDGAAGATVSSAARDAALALIVDQPATRALQVEILRGGVRRRVTIPAAPGCRSAFEVLLGPQMTAQADGSIVQIGVRFFERYTDDEVAVIVAHELSHNILRHRARLDAAKVNRGLLSELGRNGRLFRRTEDDADALGVVLLRNAGYDPRSAVRFWREHGGDIDGGLFRSRTHASSGARADAIAAEIARIPADAPKPYLPPLLATRDQPLQ